MIIRDFMKRNVFYVHKNATIFDAAEIVVNRHIGLLPVLDDAERLIGVVGLKDLLTLEMPAFFDLISDVDFVHDFGAVETSHPSQEQLMQPVTSIMQPATSVEENCGLLRAYALMLKRNLHDLPVVSSTGKLVGIASRVDIGTAILATWKNIKDAQ